METQLSSAMNQSNSKPNGGKSRYPSMDQQLTSVMTSMKNVTNYLDNEGKNSYYNHPSMAKQFFPVKNSMMNLTHLKDTREKKSRIFSFSDTDNEISVCIIKQYLINELNLTQLLWLYISTCVPNGQVRTRIKN